MSSPSDDYVENAVVTLALHILLEFLPMSRYESGIQHELKIRINRLIERYNNPPEIHREEEPVDDYSSHQ